MMAKIKNALIRSIGVIMFAFIPGMAAGSATVGWLMGGIIGVATAFSSIIIFLGVTLSWDANISDKDIEKAFRAAVAKQDSKEVKEAIAVEATESINIEDIGDVSDLFHEDGEPK
jgi:hypothetical protein